MSRIGRWTAVWVGLSLLGAGCKDRERQDDDDDGTTPGDLSPTPGATEEPAATHTPEPSPEVSATPAATPAPGDDDTTADTPTPAPESPTPEPETPTPLPETPAPLPDPVPLYRNDVMTMNHERTIVTITGEWRNASASEIMRFGGSLWDDMGRSYGETYIDYPPGSFFPDWTPFELQIKTIRPFTCGFDPVRGEPYLDRNCATWRPVVYTHRGFGGTPNEDTTLPPMVRNDVLIYDELRQKAILMGEVWNPYDLLLKFFYSRVYLTGNEEEKPWPTTSTHYPEEVSGWRPFELELVVEDQLPVWYYCGWDAVMGEPYLDRSCVSWYFIHCFYP